MKNKLTKKQREELHKKWDKVDFLKGLKGHVSDDIAKLFECNCKSTISKDFK